MGVNSKVGGDKGAQGTTRVFGAAKLQSASGGDNPCYTAVDVTL